jgi:hypothetical protein
MLDLSKTNIAEDSEAGYWFELVHPATGEGTGGHIKVRGEKSRIVQQHARKVVNEMQKREKIAKGKNKDLDLSMEELEDMAVERAVVRIIEWKDIGSAGQAIPFTKENAFNILKDNYWIREQVMEESDNLLNFRSE